MKSHFCSSRGSLQRCWRGLALASLFVAVAFILDNGRPTKAGPLVVVVSAFSTSPVNSRTSRIQAVNYGSSRRQTGQLYGSKKYTETEASPTKDATRNSNSQSDEDGNKMDPVTKASWYAVEWFGKAFGQSNQKSKGEDGVMSYSGPPKSIKETLERIKLDNDRSYFLSGQVDEEIYATDCVFRDPFVSFEGRERFVTNLANLGSFITKYDARVLEYNQPDDATIQTKIMVKLELNLPWKPILAWPWGVKYTVDPETCCVVDHEESWDIAPWEGVKQIFRKPTLKL